MNMFLQTSICSSLEANVFKWGNILVLKIILTSSDGRGVVKALGLVLATSISAGIIEKDKELVMCVYSSESLAGGSLSNAFIVNGLPAHLDDAGAFMKRPFCFLNAWILPAGARRLLLDWVH